MSKADYSYVYGLFGNDGVVSNFLKKIEDDRILFCELLDASESGKIEYSSRFNHIINDDGSIISDFLISVQNRVRFLREEMIKYKNIKSEVSFYRDIIVSEVFTYDNTIEVLGTNRDVNYIFPEEYEYNMTVDYSNKFLQFVRVFGNIEPREVPYPVLFGFICSGCGERYTRDNQMVFRCRCGRKVSRCREDDVSVNVYATQVTIDGSVRNAVSLVPIPAADVVAAVIPYIEDGDYCLFILAVNVVVRDAKDIEWVDGVDRLKQLRDYIDRNCHDNIGKHIVGMDSYKDSLILSAFGSYSGVPTFNVLAVGSGGTGKTSTGKLYMYSITDAGKWIDSGNFTMPGLIGSTSQMSVRGIPVVVRQSGMLEKFKMVILDEFYERKREALDALKTNLSELTISIQKHDNEKNVKRNAVVIANANIPIYHLKKLGEDNGELLGTLDDSINVFNVDSSIKSKYKSFEVSWRDGKALPLLDRFSSIYYFVSNEEVAWKDFEDLKYSDGELSILLYDPSISKYFDECSKISFKFLDSDKKRIISFINKCISIEHNDINSLNRMQMYIQRMVEYYCKLNGRGYTIDNDYIWLENFYMRNFNFIKCEDVSYDENKVVFGRSKKDDIDLGPACSVVYNFMKNSNSKFCTLNGIVDGCRIFGRDSKEIVLAVNKLVEDNKLFSIKGDGDEVGKYYI